MEITLTHILAVQAIQATILISAVTAVVKMAMKLAALETKMEPFWTYAAKRLGESLHQPHAQWRRLDELIEKFDDDPYSLTLEECIEAIKLCLRHRETVKDVDLAEDLRDNFYINAFDIHKRDREFKNQPLWKRLWIALQYLLS